MTDDILHRSIALDFDGVLHGWDGQWVAVDHLSGKPINGSIAFVRTLLEASFDITIVTSRCVPLDDHLDDSAEQRVQQAVRGWLVEHGLDPEAAKRIRVTGRKVVAGIYLDDRAWRFTGSFPTVEEILAFRPWWKLDWADRQLQDPEVRAAYEEERARLLIDERVMKLVERLAVGIATRPCSTDDPLGELEIQLTDLLDRNVRLVPELEAANAKIEELEEEVAGLREDNRLARERIEQLSEEVKNLREVEKS